MRWLQADGNDSMRGGDGGSPIGPRPGTDLLRDRSPEPAGPSRRRGLDPLEILLVVLILSLLALIVAIAASHLA